MFVSLFWLGLYSNVTTVLVKMGVAKDLSVLKVVVYEALTASGGFLVRPGLLQHTRIGSEGIHASTDASSRGSTTCSITLPIHHFPCLRSKRYIGR